MEADRSKNKWLQFIGELHNSSGQLANTGMHELGGNCHKYGKRQKRYGDKVRIAIRIG